MLGKLEEDIQNFNIAYDSGDSYKEYLEFSRFVQDCFLKEHTYIIDTGNFQTANKALIGIIYNMIKKHPIIWRLFFRY